MSSMASSLLPNLQTVTVGLTSVLRSHGSTNGKLTVLDRQPNIYTSTFPSEIVTCQFDDDNRELQLLCKYGADYSTSRDGRTSNVFGHKGGVPYEAAVYRHVLQSSLVSVPISSRVSVPTFYGAYKDATTGDTWLILEYLD